MLTFDNKIYLTDKEAATRYGFSDSWFQKQRCKDQGPPYIRVFNKIYYDQSILDEWFKKQRKVVD
jgi:hypothetical protein